MVISRIVDRSQSYVSSTFNFKMVCIRWKVSTYGSDAYRRAPSLKSDRRQDRSSVTARKSCTVSFLGRFDIESSVTRPPALPRLPPEQSSALAGRTSRDSLTTAGALNLTSRHAHSVRLPHAPPPQLTVCALLPPRAPSAPP